uniref:Zinc finger HIT domain-containing protein 3 n=1 Tax=Anthurium amnicola TaxID=1678845 RepID=A0A1D1YUT3_9ARAE
MGPPRPCGVCKAVASKYKCPSCLLPYCSMTCFKKHKEIPCEALPPSQKTVSVAFPKRPCQVDEESWVLRREQLQSLVNSHEIRDVLKNEELRNLICTIDCSEHPDDELEKAMKEQLLRGFTDQILSIVSPIE